MITERSQRRLLRRETESGTAVLAARVVFVVLTVSLSVSACAAPAVDRDSTDQTTGTETASAPERTIVAGGFDVTERSIELDRMVAGGPSKGGIPAIDDPRFVSATEADFLEDEDLVVGLVHGNASKAYPLRILTWHEIVNDRVGTTAIAVTFCPLTGSSVVFDRTLAGEERRFGVSGWLYENNVLMYDHANDSLWTQLGAQAVAGKDTGKQLSAIPSTRTSWGQWRRAHPETLVLSPDTGAARDYARNPYRLYELSADTMFPVARHDGRIQAKELVLGVHVDGRRKAYPFIELEVAGASNVVDRIGGNEITVHFDGNSAHATQDGRLVEAVVVYWFAWSVFHPDTDLWTALRPSSVIPDEVELSAARAELHDNDGYWTSMGGAFSAESGSDNHSSSGLFVIKGTLENVSKQPIRRVDLKFELIGAKGAPVYAELGVNRLAEADIMLSDEELAAKPAEETTMLMPGATDDYRMIFIGNEIPEFVRTRVTVVATH